MNERKERFYDVWARRNPAFESRFENIILRELSDYGVGASALTDAKGKILGAGYEPYIIAFFIGLYADKKIPLNGDVKTLGQPLQYWGNVDSKKGRSGYSRLREYIFAALVARTDIDLLALDKGEISVKKCVDELLKTMEEYANYGFYLIEEKMKIEKGYFFRSTAFLDLILCQIPSEKTNDDEIDDDSDSEPESLD